MLLLQLKLTLGRVVECQLNSTVSQFAARDLTQQREAFLKNVLLLSHFSSRYWNLQAVFFQSFDSLFTFSRRSLPGLNLIARLGGTSTLSPVRGLRLRLAACWFTVKLAKPRISMCVPRARASDIAESIASMTSSTSRRVSWPNLAAISSMRSERFTLFDYQEDAGS